MPHACLNRYLHKLRIASSKPVLRDTNVVFKTGSDCSAVSCEHPIHHLSLMSSYAGSRPSSIRKNASELAVQKIQDRDSAGSAFLIPITN